MDTLEANVKQIDNTFKTITVNVMTEHEDFLAHLNAVG
jgi:hypothetical protein